MRRNSYLKVLSLLISFSIVFISTFTGKAVMASTDEVYANLLGSTEGTGSSVNDPWDGANGLDVTAVEYAGGDGSEANPYLIVNGDQLYKAATEGESKYFRLENDIYLNDVSDDYWYSGTDLNEWITGGNTFCGHFDGNGYVVHGIYYKDTATEMAALFPRLGAYDDAQSVTVKNVGIEDSYIQGVYAGAITGCVDGNRDGNHTVSVSCCYADESVYLKGTQSNGFVAFLFNYYFTMDNCASRVRMIGTARTDEPIGSLLGNMYLLPTENGATNVDNAKKITIKDSYAVLQKEDRDNGFSAVPQSWTGRFVRYENIHAGVYPDGNGNSANTNYSLGNAVNCEFAHWPSDFRADDRLYFSSKVWIPGDGEDCYMIQKVFCYSTNDGSNDINSYDIWNGKNGLDVASVEYAGGDGSESNPYLIKNGDQLYKAAVEGERKYFRMENDIYLNDVSSDRWYQRTNLNEWITGGASFMGNFDGNGYVVYGIYYPDSYSKETDSKAGLFPCATVDNDKTVTVNGVGVKNAYLNGTYVGAIIGEMTGGSDNADQVIISCCFAGDSVRINGSAIQGGIIGALHRPLTIENCYSLADIVGATDTDKEGGIIGFAAEASIGTSVKNCYAVTGDVSVTSNTWPGMRLSYSNVYGTSKGGLDLFNFPAISVLNAERMQGSGVSARFEGFDFENVWQAGYGFEYPTLIVFLKKNIEVWNGDTATSFAGGDGTAENPYLIENGGQLYYMMTLGSDNTSGKYYKLVCNIYLNDINDSDWQNNSPNQWIGNKFFAGNFNGNGNKVYGLYYSGDGASALFPGVWPQDNTASEIKNVGLESSYIKSEGAGGIIGNLSNTSRKGTFYMSNCYVGENTEICGTQYQGGLIAYTDNPTAAIENCYSLAKITGNVSSDKQGGIIGFATQYSVGTSVKNCYAVTGNVSVTSNTYPGMQLSYSNVYGTSKGDLDLFNFPAISELTTAQMQDNGAEIYMAGLDYENIWICTSESYPVLQVFCTEEELDFAGKFSGGDGTEGNPYIIKNADELYSMTSAFTSQTKGKYFKLAKDILDNTAAVDDWINYSVYVRKNKLYSKFCGFFDGNGHTVTGLYVTADNSGNAALFASLGEGAEVINVGIEKSYFEGEYAAAVAGRISGENVLIKNSYASDAVKVNGNTAAGGITAEISCNKFTMTNCYFTGMLIGATQQKGGLVGNITVSQRAGNITLSNCYVASQNDDYTVAPLSSVSGIRFINLYGTKKQVFGDNDANTNTFKTVSRENMTGSLAETNMPLLDFDSVWITKGDKTPELKVFTGTNNISGNVGSFWSGKIATDYNGGDGTRDNPYKIATPEQLALLISTSVYEPYETLGKFYELTEDIYLNNTSSAEWYTANGVNEWFFDLGYRSLGFMGNFNGNNHLVDGLCYKNVLSDMCYGLFPSLGDSAVIENVAVTNFYSPDNTERVGALVGFISLYTDSENTISVNKCISAGSNKVGGYCAGGLIGHCALPIVLSNCISMAEVLTQHSRATLIGTVDSGDKTVLIKNCLSLDVGRANSVWYNNNCAIPKLENVYSTSNSVGINFITISDIMGDKAINVLKGFDFENVWQTVEGGTPVPKGFDTAKYSKPKKAVKVTLKFIDSSTTEISGYSGDRIPWSSVSDIDNFDWYLEEKCLRKFADNTFPTYDITLYAKVKTPIWNGTSDSELQGSGTKSNPYIISNGAELYYVLNNNSTGCYRITQDIYLNDITKSDWKLNWWNVSGTFEGEIDGDGHVIYGLYSETSDNASLIAKTNGNAVVKNLAIDNSYIKGNTAGAIIADVSSTTASLLVAMCYAGEKVEVIGNDKGKQGGIIGAVYNTSTTVKNCYSAAKLLGNVNAGNQGGLVGYSANSYFLENCFAVTNGTVPATTTSGTLTATNVYGNVVDGINAVAFLSVDKMKDGYAETNLKGFDFKGAWQSGVGYPSLTVFNELRKGDANKDGNIDIRDLVRYKKLSAEVGMSDADYADLNNDGTINSEELVDVKKYLLNFYETTENKNVVQTITSAHTNTTYQLVWNDEFNTDGIDYNKWCYGYEINTVPYVNLLMLTEHDDPSIVTANNGLLKMNARRYYDSGDSAVKYATSASLGTRETMNFKYGYVEMRAMVPIKQSAFPAFWAIGKPGLINKKNNGYYIEIDFFECFTSQNELFANFHKWYDNGAHSNFYPPENNGYIPENSFYRSYSFKNYKTLPYEFHLYGFEWTKDYVMVNVDNTLFSKLSINDSYEKNMTSGNTSSIELGSAKNDMSGYHDYIYLLLQNMIYLTGENAVNENSQFSYNYWVDYIRLYQDPANADNGLIYLNDNGEKVDYYNK